MDAPSLQPGKMGLGGAHYWIKSKDILRITISLTFIIVSLYFSLLRATNTAYVNRHCNIILDHPFDFSQLSLELRRTPKSNEPFILTGSICCWCQDRKQRRGKHRGFLAKLRLNSYWPVLPSIFRTNVWSLANKLDELKTWTLVSSLMFFMGTWLSNDVLNSVVDLEGYPIFRTDRTAATSDKGKGGSVCTYINKTWCVDSVIVDKYCSANLEHMIVNSKPYYKFT